MIKLILISLLSFISLDAKLLVGHNIPIFKAKDQFQVEHSPTIKTKILIFAFQKNTGHILKAYFEKFEPDYLIKKDAMFIADVSAMPAIIRYFVLGDMVEHKFPIVFIEDDDVSARYKHEDYEDKIVVVNLKDLRIISIKYLETEEQLKEELK